ncbi:MAG: hypothetical protein ICV60_11590 [Pyrinomonadaceae bacterium]|nr:hypothetical protein [Pyrinomonadaceae bacterium]
MKRGKKAGFNLVGFVKLTVVLTLVLTLVMLALPAALEQTSLSSTEKPADFFQPHHAAERR